MKFNFSYAYKFFISVLALINSVLRDVHFPDEKLYGQFVLNEKVYSSLSYNYH
jgi:hypothetical protein